MRPERTWWRNQWKDIVITVLPSGLGLLTVLLPVLFDHPSMLGGADGFKEWHLGLFNAGLQTFFILVTLVVLIRCWNKVRSDAAQEMRIKRYLRIHCELRDEGEDALQIAYTVVTGTVRQFFLAWSAIWVLWLAYYSGEVIELMFSHQWSVAVCNTCLSRNMMFYKNTLNFFSSAVLFVIYLVLSEATVMRKERRHTQPLFFHGLLLVMVLALLFFVPSMIAQCGTTDTYRQIVMILSILLSVFAAVTFTLILGKLNSTYLQIPRWMISGLYLYAIIQAYAPLSTMCELYSARINSQPLHILRLISDTLPWITLFGKMLLMLMLIWISDRKRLVFYIIHQSLSLQDTPLMLRRFQQYLSQRDGCR